jgi:hypothetical protein
MPGPREYTERRREPARSVPLQHHRRAPELGPDELDIPDFMK